MEYRFGRSEHDPVALAEMPAHRFGVRIASPIVDRRAFDYTVGLYGNNELGDCTCVAMANYARGVALLNGFGLDITEDQVKALFGEVGGTTDLPAIPGLVALDVIKYQQAHGFAVTNQSLVAHAGTVDITRNALANAIERLGGAYLGVRLYERDMDSVGATWDVQDGRDDGRLVGRHMINAWDYDTTRVRIGTWGMLQPATWDWVLSRLDEAHALVWRQLAAADGLFYDGVDADGMVGEL